jgi:hypothetical protein
LTREPHIETVGSLHELEALSGIRTSTDSPLNEDELLIEELTWISTIGNAVAISSFFLQFELLM